VTTASPASVQSSAPAFAGEGARPVRSRASIGFAIGFVAAAVLTVFAALVAMSGAGVSQETVGLMWSLLLAAGAILLGMAGLLAYRIRRIARATSTQPSGARLHLRFVSLFSIAAVLPTLVVALFMGAVVTRGLEQWFSERVRTVVESGAAVGRVNVDVAEESLSTNVLEMGALLNAPDAAAALASDNRRYGEFLASLAERRNLAAAYVIDRSGRVLASAERGNAPVYVAPSERVWHSAGAGDVATMDQPDADVLRALYRMDGYSDAYLYLAAYVRPGLLSTLRRFDDAVYEYNAVERQRGQIQSLFSLSYLALAMLVLLGAVWLGLSNASRIAEPIGRLADAARRVAAGDLGVRVSAGGDRDEVDSLAAAFNRMTSQLEAQRAELVKARQEAEDRSQFTQAVLGGVSAGVIGVDRDGRITAANRSAYALLGLGDDIIDGRRLVDVSPVLGELLNTPTPSEETVAIRIDIDRAGTPAQISVRMSPVADGGGLVMTFDDMTKLIAAQRQEAWKDVARRIAHEIKNPLTPIQLSAERLQRKYHSEITSDPETFQRCTDTILRQVHDIGRMVDEFSSFARMPTPIMAFADMAEIAKDVGFAQRLSHQDVRVEVEGCEEPIGLVCDSRLIGQVLTNLLKNAAEGVQARRARDGEPKEGRVTLRLRDLEYGVQFEVTDNGLGFPVHERARLIEPYVTTRSKGMGLGLAIVARIVEDHGGILELDDAPGPAPGAVVRFVLPKRGDGESDATSPLTGES
jgi:two-component system, NtrC family, nitrogen regulation sensor histidine kinase NtrY